MRVRSICVAIYFTVAVAFFSGFALSIARAQTADPDVAKKLGDFDAYMEQTLKDWNTPGIVVGVVVGDKLALAKGYGYRDYGKKLSFTSTTMQSIASNSKLFTAFASGILAEEAKVN